jgi:predicted restriction endonuclease
MNSFFHKAYDNHLLAITPDMNIVVSDELLSGSKETTFYNYLKELNGKSILIPDKFLPQRELLDIHYQKYILR